MIVFRAMLVAAYRELNSRKLFWITLALSGMFVLAYASIGFDENGMLMAFGLFEVENPALSAGSPLANVVYRSLFATWIVQGWLAWTAIILALISTTSMFPDFIAGGAIELVLSKPVSRVRLFVNKYLSSLLFVVLQVTLFSVGIFVCMGLRVQDWEWRIFLAIPIVTLFFSYLYAVNVLVGVWTRSALAALLFTLLFWSTLFSVGLAESMLGELRQPMIGQFETDAKAASTLDTCHNVISGIQAVLPKGADTVALLDRWLRTEDHIGFFALISGLNRGTLYLDDAGQVINTMELGSELERRMDEEFEKQSTAWIIGSSLAFELVVLSLACWIFVRRDY